jgi:hypothetical protein
MKKIIIQTIIPNKLICNSNLYSIKIIDPKFIIKKFFVAVNEDNKIENVGIMDGLHPNCDLKTKLLCIPEYLKEYELNENSIKIIFNILEVFNFDSSFFQPWDCFEYEYVKEERIRVEPL